MRVIYLLGVLSLITEVASGQNHLMGARLGISGAGNTVGSDIRTHLRIGVPAGITYDYTRKKLVLGAELLYEPRGYRYDATLTDNTGAPFGEDKIKLNYNFISMPIKAGIAFGNHFFGLANIGLIPAYLIRAIAKGTNSSFVYTKNVDRFDLAVLAELGFGFKIEERLQWVTSLRYQTGLLTAPKHSSYINHWGVTLGTGIKYRIGH